jgi:two-component system chemotaxis response regulator CheY
MILRILRIYLTTQARKINDIRTEYSCFPPATAYHIESMQTPPHSTRVAKPENPYDLKAFRILIVEDYPFIADLMSSALNELGVGHVLTAPNIANAREKLSGRNAMNSPQNIDAILLDWLMPDGTGLELLQWVRSHASDTIRYLPIIVCSAYTNADLVAKSRDNGANEIMVKPVSAEKLARRLSHVIEKPRPFIKTPTFFGPDRRRKAERFSGTDRRKTPSEEIAVSHEK